MTTPEDATDIVADAGGTLAGRTRLQKSGYFLEVCDVGAGFDFSYHYYGPYSEELSVATADAGALGLMSISADTTQHGYSYDLFTTDRRHSEVDDETLSERRRILEILDSYDSIVLELAATAHYLAENGFEDDPWSETSRRKSGKATGERISKAKKLLEQLDIEI